MILYAAHNPRKKQKMVVAPYLNMVLLFDSKRTKSKLSLKRSRENKHRKREPE
jgi:hypothetical protein